MKISINKTLKMKTMMLNMKDNRVRIVIYNLNTDSVSNRKRGRKLGQKKVQDGKKVTGNGGNSYRENKYSTRGGTRVRNK